MSGSPNHKGAVLMSISDGNQVIIKSPLRSNDDEQKKAIRQLDTEMMILNGRLKNAEGIRQLIDQIILQTNRRHETRAGVFESLDTDLHKVHLTQKSRLSRTEIKSIAHQLLTALSVVHQHDIVHTDLKPENLVLTRFTDSTTSGILIKIIDFGVASLESKDRHRIITNPYWRSPESWLGMPWGPPADIWFTAAVIGSLLIEPGAVLFRPMGGFAGVTQKDRDVEFVRSLWTMLPFPQDFLKRASQEWQERISSFSPRLALTGSPTTLSFVGELFDVAKLDWEFIGDMLQVDPDKRPTAAELLDHPWLNS